MIWQWGQTPTTPAALWPAAAIVPATCVPWGTGSLRSVSAPGPKLHPLTSSMHPFPSSSRPLTTSPMFTHNCPANSGCVTSTPLSTTPMTVGLVSPCSVPQASGALMSAPKVPATSGLPATACGCPVLCSPHRSLKKESLGSVGNGGMWP